MTDKRTRLRMNVIIIAVICAVSLIVIATRTPNIPSGINDVLLEKHIDDTLLGFEPKGKDYQLYEVQVMGDDGKITEMIMDQDGVMIRLEATVKSDELPFDVEKLTPNGTRLAKIKRYVTYAKVKPVALDEPETKYKMVFLAGAKELEVTTTEDGEVIDK